MENKTLVKFIAVMATVIFAMVSAGFGILVDTFKQQKIRDAEFMKKLDTVLLQTTINDGRLNAIDSEGIIWTSMIMKNSEDIESLETGQSSATADRITKTEVYELDKKRLEYIHKYFQRKNN